MGITKWLGLERDGASKRLAAIHRAARRLLPDDEPYVVRYVVVSSILLARVAHADGLYLRAEREHLRTLLKRCGRIDSSHLDDLCDELDSHAPVLEEQEVEICYREIRSLCDRAQRERILDLLARQAVSDGKLAPSEHRVLLEAADALQVERDHLWTIERGLAPASSLPGRAE